MLENSQASHTYLLSQEFVCPRNCGWADWKQAQAQAHVNSAPAGDCSAVALPRLLARRSFLVFPPFGIDWYWDSNPALVHECINLYDTSYAVGYFHSIPDKYFYFTKHFVIFSSTFPVCFTKVGLCLCLGVDLVPTSVAQVNYVQCPSWPGIVLLRLPWQGCLEMAVECQSFSQKQILLALAQRHPKPWLWPEPFAHSLFGPA